MGIKKKLTVGAMSAALGLSLVAGGTWAAFNDIEEQTASFAAGELNLKLADVAGAQREFKVSDLKPGDKMTRSIRLENDGSLAIKDVLLSIDNIDFTDYVPKAGEPGYGDTDTYGTNSALEYLDQFKVKVVNVGDQGGDIYPIDIIVQDITLKELYLATSATVPADANEAAVNEARLKLDNTAFVKAGYFDDNRLKLTPRFEDYLNSVNGKRYAGIPVGVAHNLKIEIEFAEYVATEGKPAARDARGVEYQNKFQGDKVDVTFTLEGRQWDGQEVTEDDMNGTDVETNRKHNNGK